MKQERTHRLAG